MLVIMFKRSVNYGMSGKKARQLFTRPDLKHRRKDLEVLCRNMARKVMCVSLQRM